MRKRKMNAAPKKARPRQVPVNNDNRFVPAFDIEQQMSEQEEEPIMVVLDKLLVVVLKGIMVE